MPARDNQSFLLALSAPLGTNTEPASKGVVLFVLRGAARSLAEHARRSRGWSRRGPVEEIGWVDGWVWASGGNECPPGRKHAKSVVMNNTYCMYAHTCHTRRAHFNNPAHRSSYKCAPLPLRLRR